jgi:hypothetical protein
MHLATRALLPMNDNGPSNIIIFHTRPFFRSNAPRGYG